MLSLDNWVHANPNILLNNRTTHLEVEDNGDNPDFDAEVEKKKIEAADPFDPRLRPLTQDSPIPMTALYKPDRSAPSWTLRVYGDTKTYLNEAKQPVCHGTVVVRSLQWPGAVSFFNQGQIKQIYVGNGLKFDSTPVKYISVPVMNDEP